MARRLLGREGFRKGCDLYFARHDGQAVTTEDFVAALEDASGVDLAQFRRWYAQAGTPMLKVRSAWRDGEFNVEIEQGCPPTPGQADKQPLHIPLLLGLLGEHGEDLLEAGLEFAGGAEVERRGPSLLVHLREATTQLRVRGLGQAPRLSLLRGFSAPVRVHYPRSAEELAFLARHDSDGFARWDAMQSLLLGELRTIQEGGEVSQLVLELFGGLVAQAQCAQDAEAGSMLRELLSVPSESYVFEQLEQVDVDAVIGARDKLVATLSEALADAWRGLYEAKAPAGRYAPDAEGMARRGLRNLALHYLSECESAEAHRRLSRHLEAADNLTDRLAALGGIANSAAFPERERALDDFHERWRGESLVVDQWLQVQAACRRSDAAAVRKLEGHPAFDAAKPNKLRALYGAFGGRNNRNFHAAGGAGYDYLATALADLDARNPQMAARLLTPLTRWRKFDPNRQSLMRTALQRIKAQAKLSKDVFEVVTKSLDG